MKCKNELKINMFKVFKHKGRNKTYMISEIIWEGR